MAGRDLKNCMYFMPFRANLANFFKAAWVQVALVFNIYFHGTVLFILRWKLFAVCQFTDDVIKKFNIQIA